MILIIGAPDEQHSKYIYDKLINKNEDVAYFDTRQVPSNLLINWNPDDKDVAGYFKIDNNKIFFKDIKSVYWRTHYGLRTKHNTNNQKLLFILNKELESAYNSVFCVLNCLWINSIDAIELHRKKGYQLYLMAQNNIRIPKTLVTNDTDEIMQFMESNNNRVIFKPVNGGALTEILTPAHLTKERLDGLKNSPVQFQELIEGVDIRVYGINNKLFAAKIVANTIDFRGDSAADIVPIELPDNIRQDCFKIMELFKLKLTGIDIRLTPEGEYVFIEANPSPMFIHFEKMTNYPISENLCEMLINA